MRGRFLVPFLLPAAWIAAGPVPAVAEEMAYTAALSPRAEVPPHGDLSGTGMVKAHFDAATRTLSYTATYSGLTGPATAAHFHGPADPGQNAGVLIPVNGALGSPIAGSAVLTPDQAKALEAGKLYFNIHTAANKGGEVRGQVVKAD